jgi:hypothetical protein
MTPRDEYLAQDDAALLADCDTHTYRASGPGGQHRNKVSSAVRLVHRPTGLVVTAQASRSQHTNRRTAVQRLRMNLACRLRACVDLGDVAVPPVVAECLSPLGRGQVGKRRLCVGRRDRRFWRVAAFLLDLLNAAEGSPSAAAAAVNVTTSHLVAVLKSQRHLFAAAQAIRRERRLGPLR